MAVAYKSAGAGAGTETSGAALSLACPAVVAANDILIAHVTWLDIVSSPSTPANWTLLYGPAALGTGTAVGRSWVFGKLAVGTEDGTAISFGTAGGTAGRFGRIYSFSGYVSGTITDVVPAASFTDTPVEDDPALPTVATTVAGALAVALIAQDDNNALAAGGAQTGGTWAEPVAEFVSTALGAQGCVCQIQTCTPDADPGTVTGGVLTTAADESSTIGFEIRPNVPTSTPHRAIIGWAELEVPNAPRRARIGWAELEVPTAPRRARIGWAELEVPTAPRRARIGWAELEVPAPPTTERAALIGWAEFEVPNAPRRGLIGWAEFEVPLAPRRAIIAWAELQVPSVGEGNMQRCVAFGKLIAVGRLLNH